MINIKEFLERQEASQVYVRNGISSIKFLMVQDWAGRQKIRGNVLWVKKANYGSGPSKVEERAC